jgi:adenylate kinase
MEADVASRLVAVFGISGVGKSTVIRNYVAGHRDWIHVVASDVIKVATQQASEMLRTAPLTKVIQNQDLLVEGVAKIRADNADRNILLDAHSVIDSDNKYILIPVDVIRALRPDLLVFLCDDPQSIQTRRELDNFRLRPKRDLNQIEEYQRIALDTVQGYARELAIPVSVIKVNDQPSLVRALEV